MDRRCEFKFNALRALAARQWRQGRQMLSELPEEEQGQLLAYWNDERACCLPRKTEYFADLVRNWEAVKRRTQIWHPPMERI
jgi:hypothetical protein